MSVEADNKRETVKALIKKFENFPQDYPQDLGPSPARGERSETPVKPLRPVRTEIENRRTPSRSPSPFQQKVHIETEKRGDQKENSDYESVQSQRVVSQPYKAMDQQQRPSIMEATKREIIQHYDREHLPLHTTSVGYHETRVTSPSQYNPVQNRQPPFDYMKREVEPSLSRVNSLIPVTSSSGKCQQPHDSVNYQQMTAALTDELALHPHLGEDDQQPLMRCITILKEAHKSSNQTTNKVAMDHLKLRQLETENQVLKKATEQNSQRIEEMDQMMREERQECDRMITDRESSWKDDMYQMEQKFLKERQEYDRILSEREDFWKKEMDLMVDQESKRILGEREDIWKQELGQMEQKFIKEMQENDRMLAEREEAWKQEMDQMINKLLEEKEVVYENFLTAQANITEQMDLTESLWKQRLDQTMREYKQKCDILEEQVKELEYKLDHIRREWIEQETLWTDKERVWVSEKEAYEKKLNVTGKEKKKLFRGKESKKASISEAEQKETDQKWPSVSKFRKLIEEQKNSDMQQMITDINYLRRVFLIVEQLEAENDSLTEENNQLTKKELSTSQAFQEMEHKYNKERQNYERIQTTNQKIEEDIRFLQERVQEEKKYKEQANSELKKVMSERDKACRDQNELREILWKQEQTVEQARLKIHKLFKEKEALYEKLQSAQQKSTDMKKEMKTTELKLFQSRSKRVETTTAKALRERLDLLEGLWKQKVEQYTEVKDVQHQLDCIMREWKEQETNWSNKETLWYQEREELEERMKKEKAQWYIEKLTLERTVTKKKEKGKGIFRTSDSRKTTVTPEPSYAESAPGRRERERERAISRLQDYHPEPHEEDRSEKTADAFGELASSSEPGGPAQDNDSVAAETSADAENAPEPQPDTQTPEEDKSAAP